MSDVQIAVIDQQNTEVTVAVPGIQGIQGQTGDVAVAQDGTAGTPGIRFENDTNTGIYRPGADQLALSTNGTGRLFVDASGRVGIGGSPSEKLHVYGPTSTVLRLESTSDNRELNIACGHTGFDADQIIGQSSSLRLTANGFENLRLGGSSIIGYTSGSERLRITSAGLVGIGTSTVDELLHVESSGLNPRVKVESTGTNSYPGVRLTNDARTYDIQIDGATDALRVYDATAAAGRISIASNGDINIDNGGVFYDASTNRLAIGTTSPSEKLEVVGTIKATDINFTGLATYADNAAAITGGLVAGDVYKTATGELRITV